MRSRTFGAALFLFAAAVASAQENSADIISAMKDRAVVLELKARVVENDTNETWNSATSKVTIPGRSVTVKLVGTNIVVAVQFTPYKTEDGKNILVAQGQVWVSTKDEGMLYYTSMQTVPVEFGERVYFFPLGQKRDDKGARIEVQLVMTPYADSDQAKKASPAASPTTASPAKTDVQKTDSPNAEQSKTETQKPNPSPKTDGEKRAAE